MSFHCFPAIRTRRERSVFRGGGFCNANGSWRDNRFFHVVIETKKYRRELFGNIWTNCDLSAVPTSHVDEKSTRETQNSGGLLRFLRLSRRHLINRLEKVSPSREARVLMAQERTFCTLGTRGVLFGDGTRFSLKQTSFCFFLGEGKGVTAPDSFHIVPSTPFLRSNTHPSAILRDYPARNGAIFLPFAPPAPLDSPSSCLLFPRTETLLDVSRGAR